MTGIDVSHWQGTVDFKKVKKSGIDFAIIKAGGSDAGFYKDSRFERNYEKARDANIFVGSYYFVGPNCVSFSDGVADAERFLQIIKGKNFDFPVVLDIEKTPVYKRNGATDAAIGFCETLENAGAYAMIYASDVGGFKDRLVLSRLTAFDKWVARYGSRPKYVQQYGMWQKSSRGTVDGIKGFVDLDDSYVDYPAIMERKKLNRF